MRTDFGLFLFKKTGVRKDSGFFMPVKKRDKLRVTSNEAELEIKNLTRPEPYEEVLRYEPQQSRNKVGLKEAKDIGVNI